MGMMKMKSKTIWLNKNKRKTVAMDRDEYFAKYSVTDYGGNFKELMKGSPIMVNVCGTYCLLDSLWEVVENGSAFSLQKYINQVKCQDWTESNGYVLRWR